MDGYFLQDKVTIQRPTRNMGLVTEQGRQFTDITIVLACPAAARRQSTKEPPTPHSKFNLSRYSFGGGGGCSMFRC